MPATAAASRGLGRGIEYTYTLDEIAAPMLEQFGVASNGQVSVAGNGLIKGNPTAAHGSLYITTNLNPVLTMTGPSEITGDVYIKNPAATTSIAANCRIGGTADVTERSKHIHKPLARALDRPDQAAPARAGDAGDRHRHVPAVRHGQLQRRDGQQDQERAHPRQHEPDVCVGATIDGIVFIESPNRVSSPATARSAGSSSVRTRRRSTRQTSPTTSSPSPAR